MNIVNGSLVTTWNGRSETTINASAPAGSSQVRIYMHDPAKISKKIIDKEHATLKGSVEKINRFIEKAGYKNGIVLSGSVTAESQLVDFYENGEEIGHRHSITGEVSASIGELTAELEIPTSAPGVKIGLGGSLKNLAISAKAEGAVDDSQQDRYQKDIKGTITMGAGLSVSAALAIGIPNGATVIELKGEGQTGISGSGTIRREDKNIVLETSVGADALKVTATLKWKLGLDITFAEGEDTYGESFSQKYEPVVIYTLD